MKELSENLVEVLKSRKRKDSWLEKKANGFHIWGTIGFDVLLFPDGRLMSYIWQDDDRDGSFSEITDEPTQFTAIRAASCNIPELKEILPKFKGKPCSECCFLVEEKGVFEICSICGGRGKVI